MIRLNITSKHKSIWTRDTSLNNVPNCTFCNKTTKTFSFVDKVNTSFSPKIKPKFKNMRL